jgi:hypothetical protein
MPNDELWIIPKTVRIQLADGEVVEMELDEYLKGVVPTEMGLQKPIEALRAQAIAARSFAVTTRRHALDGFDLCTTTHCQVYKPQNRYPDADQAVDETSGQVVIYQGRIVAAHFFAHCDGHTRNSEDVWSGQIPYYRSVPCICGYDELYGHGVGMCQRGATAMAKQGASTQEIVQHYYTGVEIGQATIVPRASLQESIIFGQVVDEQGRPQRGERLHLDGPGGRRTKGTAGDGRFWFSGLPAGAWELQVKGKPIRYGDLLTDGSNSIKLEVAVPPLSPLRLRSVPIVGRRQVMGTLGYRGVPVTVVDPAGNETTVLSGSAAEYDPGGFALPLGAEGTYSLRLLGQRFDLEVGDTGIWVQFSPGS